MQALVDFAVDHFGGLDIMFNNAGIGSPLKRFLPDDLEDFSRIMSVNLFGVIAGAQRGEVHEGQRGRLHHQQRVHRGDQRGAGMISYRASKAAVAHVTKCLAIDLAPYGIRVNCLTPAHIRTGITTYEMAPVLRYMQPLEREAQPEDVANAVVFLASERAAQVTGIVFPIDGGTTAGPPYAQTKLIMSTARPPGGVPRRNAVSRRLAGWDPVCSPGQPEAVLGDDIAVDVTGPTGDRIRRGGEQRPGPGATQQRIGPQDAHGHLGQLLAGTGPGQLGQPPRGRRRLPALADLASSRDVA